MTSDDLYYKYAVEVKDFRDLWKAVIYGRDGRILGNLGTIVLVRSQAAKVIWKTIVMILLPFLFICLLDIKNRTSKLLCVALCFFPCTSMFAQIYVWTSGFNNYMPPMVITLLALIVLKSEFLSPKVYKCILLLVLGIFGTLFLETASMFMLEIAILALVYGWRKNRINGGMIVYLVSTIAGSIVIFGERKIVGSTISTVQGIGIENIWALYRRILEYTEKYVQTISSCVLLIGVLSVVTVIPMLNDESKEHEKINKICMGILISFPVYSVLNVAFVKSLYYSEGWSTFLLLVWFAAYMIAVLRSVVLYYSQSKLYIMIIIGSFVVYAPIYAVTIVRERNCYISYVLLVGMVLMMFEDQVEIFPDRVKMYLNRALISGLISLVIVMFMICADWSWVSKVRNAYLEREIEAGATTILMPELPHKELLQADGDSNYWKYYTDKVYGKGIDIKFCEWYEWLTKR